MIYQNLNIVDFTKPKINGFIQIRDDVTFKEVREYLQNGFDIFDYVTFGEKSPLLLIDRWLSLYPLPYTPPRKKYVVESLQDIEDSYQFSSGLVDDEPARLQVFLNIAIEYFKFTGEILWRDTFGQEGYEKFFTRWKKEHIRRFKRLKGIIESNRQ